MKRKALLSMIVAVSICAAITGCGKTDEEVSNGTEQPSYNEAMGIIDSEVVTPHNVIAPEALDIEPTQEILEADIDSRKIQLGNKVYTLPVTLQTLLDDGAIITNDANPINEVCDAWKTTVWSYNRIVQFSIDQIQYDLVFYNRSNEKKQVKDCLLTDTDVSSSDSVKNLVIYPKGIRIGSSIAELKSAWGEPTIDDLNKYFYYDEYSYLDEKGETQHTNKYSYSISVDLEKQTITDIVYEMDYDYYTGNVENLVDDTEQAETSAEESEPEAPVADEESIETSTIEE